MSGLPLNEYGYPQFSLAERSRRFVAIRERMRLRGLDAIIIRSDSSKMDSGSAEGRYLTHIGGKFDRPHLCRMSRRIKQSMNTSRWM